MSFIANCYFLLISFEFWELVGLSSNAKVVFSDLNGKVSLKFDDARLFLLKTREDCYYILPYKSNLGTLFIHYPPSICLTFYSFGLIFSFSKRVL